MRGMGFWWSEKHLRVLYSVKRVKRCNTWTATSVHTLETQRQHIPTIIIMKIQFHKNPSQRICSGYGKRVRHHTGRAAQAFWFILSTGKKWAQFRLSRYLCSKPTNFGAVCSTWRRVWWVCKVFLVVWVCLAGVLGYVSGICAPKHTYTKFIIVVSWFLVRFSVYYFNPFRWTSTDCDVYSCRRWLFDKDIMPHRMFSMCVYFRRARVWGNISTILGYNNNNWFCKFAHCGWVIQLDNF